MAFGNKQRKINELSLEVERLKWAEPYIDDAHAIHNEVAEVLANPTGTLTAAEVAAQAIARVRRDRLQEVYVTLAEQITEEQEQFFFEEILQEVRDREGDEIRHKVEQSLRVNPELKRKLTAKARSLLWHESKREMLEEIKQREQEHVDAELARQKIFNQSNLDFSLSAHIDLASNTLRETYKTGDILQVSYGKCNCYKSPHKPPTYSYAESNEGVLWQYMAGDARGVRHPSALTKPLSLYRLGCLEASSRGEDEAQSTWDILRRDRQIHVQFFSDASLKNDRLKNLCSTSNSQVANVTLFTPIAYAQHTQQQQN